MFQIFGNLDITESSLQVDYVETIHTKRDLEGPYLAMYAFHNQDFFEI